jgi:SAM-dependent methyltransferase
MDERLARAEKAGLQLGGRLPPDEPLAHIPCPLCESTAYRVVLYGRDRLFGRPGYYPVVQCTECGVKYVNPRPTVQALGRHYPDDYFPSRLPGTLSPIVRLLSGVLFDMRWGGYVRLIESVIGRIVADTKVVDVGCGLNHLLVRLERLRGCRGLGIDFKPEMVAYIREQQRMPVSLGTLEDAHLEDASVDLITMNEYFEHEPEPGRVLREARRISKTGAHLVIEVPYIGGLTARMFRSCWSQLDVPRHLVFYTPETLERILPHYGYRLIHVTRFGAPFSFGISVLQALGFKNLGRMRPIDVLLIALAGTPFLPFFPWLHEFIFAVARAESPEALHAPAHDRVLARAGPRGLASS